MKSTLFTLAVILPSIRLKIAFWSIPSGTQDWKGGGTLSFPSTRSTILAATDMHKGKPQQGTNMQYGRCYFKSYDIMIMSD